MTAEIIQFIPRANPALTEARETASVMHAGKLKCATSECNYGPDGCTVGGCLLRSSDTAPSDMNMDEGA